MMSKRKMGQSVETSIDLRKNRRSARHGLVAGPRGAASLPDRVVRPLSFRPAGDQMKSNHGRMHLYRTTLGRAGGIT